MKNKKTNIKNSKDYSNVDFGEYVGDKEIENIFKSTGAKYIIKEKKIQKKY